MARQDLSGLTPEERTAHKRNKANERKRKQREKQKDEREMAKKRNTLTSNSPEVVEFVNEIQGLGVAAMTELVAAWEREYKQKLPVEPLTGAVPGESSAEYWERRNRHRDLVLAKMLSIDFFGRQKAADRKKAYDDREAAKAAKMGITVHEMQKRKKIAEWKAGKEAARIAREMERLARNIAA